ncbi:DUF3087 family protein [Algibacillus agarilyticus]|uniref:DUF3087 family protein n=1 Tax=Algibacillus agarilyticus TaxID=2234133 RepID=UPI000DCFE326|nr:DUF3087 family protein [Algibacillus agarilyticus]
MQLIKIDKARYRKHLNHVIIACIVTLASLSLGISTVLIHFLSTGEGSNFWLNFSGVAIACVIIGWVLNNVKNHPYLLEVKYVWDLKQVLNLISRYNGKIDQGVSNNEPDALYIRRFSLAASKQVYLLDDNTITIVELNAKLATVERQIEELNLSIDFDDFDIKLLNAYK